MKRISILFAILLFSFAKVNAQTQHQNSGWLFFLNSTKFNEKWGLHLDVQLRSADDWDHLRNTLIRPGLTYYINKNQNVTLGYALVQTYFKDLSLFDATSGIVAKSTINEQRIWEQYILTHKIKSVFASHRFRLEQRFVERNFVATNTDPDYFSQRLRYFFRLIKPLQKATPTFTKGAFVALQNEVFLNIQNKEKVNNSLFDQNRLYLAGGYRFSKSFDLELGYLNQAQHGAQNNTINNVVQFAIYTRF
ncbi:DUF2490 domain-containing protein [Pedobacter yonginense]|uniref:DUF2490 domain-containing protein n=1 Tax=Pedobacter yonginense TaxID=651869 RepID=A0A317EME2_9SPHI|nr:DUF2490 domain-containing protein [Pedobacter yonginense]PWS27139.1 DUF2490 domain-containing protein [Pedobacter yonginense]